MKRTVQILIFCCTTITALALPASRANADPSRSGFVCKVISYDASEMPAYGEHGFVTVNFTSLPDCKGGYLGHGYMYSRGAKSRGVHADYLLGNDALKGTVKSLRWAAAAKQRVAWESCPGKQFCISGYAIGYAGKRPSKKLDQKPGWNQTIRQAFARLLQELSVVRL